MAEQLDTDPKLSEDIQLIARTLQYVSSNPGSQFDLQSDLGRKMHNCAHTLFVKGDLTWLGEKSAAERGTASGWYLRNELPAPLARGQIENPRSIRDLQAMHAASRRPKTRTVTDAPPIVDTGTSADDDAPLPVVVSPTPRRRAATPAPAPAVGGDVVSQIAALLGPLLQQQGSQVAKPAPTPTIVTRDNLVSAMHSIERGEVRSCDLDVAVAAIRFVLHTSASLENLTT